jgi:hypothetical protein
MIDYSDVESVIENCFEQLQEASREKYDSDKADRTAALFLAAQMKLAFVIEEVEMKAKNAKNEIARVEGEKYFEFKTNGTGKNTENTIKSNVDKDADVVAVKLECAKQEANVKKWNYIMATLKDSHIYFRNVSKSKSWQE